MEKWFASVAGTVGALISFAVDGLGLAVVILIVMMGIDYVTGIMTGIINQNLNSRIGFNGIIRKFYYLFLVGAIYAIGLLVPGIEYAGDGAAIALCVLELISITENGTKIGLPIPKYIQNVLLIIKNETDKEGEQK